MKKNSLTVNVSWLIIMATNLSEIWREYSSIAMQVGCSKYDVIAANAKIHKSTRHCNGCGPFARPQLLYNT